MPNTKLSSGPSLHTKGFDWTSSCSSISTPVLWLQLHVLLAFCSHSGAKLSSLPDLDLFWFHCKILQEFCQQQGQCVWKEMAFPVPKAWSGVSISVVRVTKTTQTCSFDFSIRNYLLYPVIFICQHSQLFKSDCFHGWMLFFGNKECLTSFCSFVNSFL